MTFVSVSRIPFHFRVSLSNCVLTLETENSQDVPRDYILQLVEVGCTETGDGVPAFRSLRTRSQQEYNTGKRGATYIETWRPTARIVADRDIVEGSREDSSDGVDQGIEESKRWELLLQAGVV